MKNRSWMVVAALALVAMMVGVAQADVVGIPLVRVGDAGNTADLSTGYGAVAYTYYIGQTDVTDAQYCAFLNAKLPDISDPATGTVLPDDTYGLYNVNMMTQVYGGINYDPNAASGSKFSVKTGYTAMPVNYVSWYDAVRFVNWLQNGQGNGDTETGTYTITNGGQNSGIVSARATPTGNEWVLPSEDEWYKAAYYKGGGINSGYWTYATQSNTLPTSQAPPGGVNSANYYSSTTGYALTGTKSFNPSLDYMTNVGSYASSVSAYGTLDQNGDVWQWNEALIGGTSRGLRGGSFYDLSTLMASSYRNNYDPSYEADGFGFRVALVPEPGSLTLLVCGAIIGLIWRKRRS